MLAHLLYGAIRPPLWGYVAFTVATVQLMFLGITCTFTATSPMAVSRLQQIWEEMSASHGRALERSRELCARAEGSGILALRKFALGLRTYAPAAGSD